MGRPKNTLPSKEYKMRIPLDLSVRMELELTSELEGRIPYGALSNFVSELIRAHYKAADQLIKQHAEGTRHG